MEWSRLILRGDVVTTSSLLAWVTKSLCIKNYPVVRILKSLYIMRRPYIEPHPPHRQKREDLLRLDDWNVKFRKWKRKYDCGRCVCSDLFFLGGIVSIIMPRKIVRSCLSNMILLTSPRSISISSFDFLQNWSSFVGKFFG